MQALRFDLVVEQERVAKMGKELQRLSERHEDQEARATEALQKMATSIEKAILHRNSSKNSMKFHIFSYLKASFLSSFFPLNVY